MTKPNEFDAFLNAVGPLALVERDARQNLLKKDAPEFSALSFFRSSETISTEILAYLLRPSAQHGQDSMFLETFLEVLGVLPKGSKVQSADVQINVPCRVLGRRRFMDIFIRLRSDPDVYLIVFESKSHDADDQIGQVADYLQFLKDSVPRNAYKRLFYLGNTGEPPNPKSIPREQWDHEEKAGICHAENYKVKVGEWVKLSKSKCSSEKLRNFLDDFAVFVDLEDENTMTRRASEFGQRIEEIISGRAEADNGGDFEAIMRIYELHDEIWEKAISICLERACERLSSSYPELKYRAERHFKDGQSCIELKLYKTEWLLKGDSHPVLWAQIGSEDNIDVKRAQKGYRGVTWFDLTVRKTSGLNLAGEPVFEEKHNKLKGADKRESLPGIRDIRNSEGIRQLLTSQAADDIVVILVRYFVEHQDEMDKVFKSHMSKQSSPI